MMENKINEKYHKTADVSADAKIGEGTKIWHNCQVQKGAIIGKGCILGHNCFIATGAKIGDGVKLESNIDVWDKVVLENDVFVGPSAVFTNDINPRAKYPKERSEWKETIVKEGATIGANATIVCGNTIGRRAFIGAGGVVTKDVKDYAVVVGVPAKQIGWMCECGAKLPDELKCAICQREYIANNDGIKPKL